MRILLVEDNAALADALVKALEQESFCVDHLIEGLSVESFVKMQEPDAVVLDLGLPDIDGLDVLKITKKLRPNLPVVILTARDALDDKVAGLNAGADDYLAKPFEMAELLARLRVVERRIHKIVDESVTVGDVCLFLNEHKVTYKGERVELSKREFALLKALMNSCGKVVTRSNLEAKLYNWDDDVSSNAMEVHIHNLRKKLGKTFIHTIRGIGYSIKKI